MKAFAFFFMILLSLALFSGCQTSTGGTADEYSSETGATKSQPTYQNPNWQPEQGAPVRPFTQPMPPP